jgi:chromate reductase
MSPATVNVLGLAGSLRQKSFNRALLDVARPLLPAGMAMQVFDLAPIPVFNDDVWQAGAPAPVAAFREAIARADALLIACPEYNYSASGVLKNALDWASRPPDPPVMGKPVAIMGAAGGILGTGRAQYHLRQIGVFFDWKIVNKPEVFIAQAHTKFDDAGNLKDDTAKAVIGTLLKNLYDWTVKLRG